MYKILKSMYSRCVYTVKVDGYASAGTMSKSGVKQGCNSSPLLSNIYQNELHEISNTDCDPLKLSDDVVIKML